MKNNLKKMIIFGQVLFIITVLSCTGSDSDDFPTNGELHTSSISIYFTNPPNDPTVDDALVNMIQKQSINSTMEVCFYGLNRENVIQAIEAAIDKGVQVRFVGNKDSGEDYYVGYLRIALALDSKFGGSRALDLEGDYPDFKLRNSAIMHNKFVIVTDSTGDQTLYMGTTNATDSGFKNNNNNSIFFKHNGIADHYRAQFEYLLGVSGTAITSVGHFVIDTIPIDVLFAPNTLDRQTAMDHLMTLADNASDSIRFMIFSFPYMPLNMLMLDKHDSGIDVKGVVDLTQLNNSAEEYLAQQGLPIKIDGNTHVIEGHGGKLHHKTMIIDADEDDAVVVTGSFNWSNNANDNNDENLIFIHSSDIAKFYEIEFDKRWAEATDISIVTEFGDDAAYQDVVISEVMWMGSRENNGTSTWGEEFIELRNMTSSQIDLSAWSIKGAAMSQKPIVLPAGSYILPDSYLVIMNEYPSFGDYAYAPPTYIMHRQITVSNSDMLLILEDPDRTVIDYAGNGSDGDDFVGLNGSGSEGDKASMARSFPAADGREVTSWFTSSIQENIDSNYTDHTYGSPGAANEGSVVSYELRDIIVSEIAWAGTDNSSSDEWIELYNRSGADITFDANWVLDTVDGGLTINLINITIADNGYLLLERTDDTIIPDISADIIYTGSLGNIGDQLVLTYNGNTIDLTPATWTSGASSPAKLSMQRAVNDGDGVQGSSWADGIGDVEGAFGSGN